MIEIWIPKIDQIGQITMYNVEIRNASSVAKCTKRFSDFLELRDALKLDWDLPSRLSSYYKSKQNVTDERKTALEELVRYILNNDSLKLDDRVLQFFSLPKSFILEDDMVNNDKAKLELKSKTTVDSPQKWMVTYKLSNSTLQDVRNKLFGNYDIVDIKSKLRTVESNLEPLLNFISVSNELSEYDRKSRKDLLINLKREFIDIQKLASELMIAPNPPSTSLQSQTLNNSNRAGRMLGKPKETELTRKFDNKGLLQVQKDTIKSQDEDLDQLREIIYRQKQMGMAINEELSIHNELLNELNDSVDSSEQKLSTARHKINKIV